MSFFKKCEEGGDKYLYEYYSKKFDKPDLPSFRISHEEAAKAKDHLSGEVREALDFGIERVTAFAQAQKESMAESDKEMLPGMILGQRVIPVDSCGCYIPTRCECSSRSCDYT